ncbi:MAG: LysR family transcriptional regulator [Myxococcota bacterium]
MDPLSSIDLNLLLALHHLLETASVQRASVALGVGQPATSASLARLRTLLGDPLLIRDGRTMRRTERADELRARVQQVMEDTRGLLAAVAPFDPSVDVWTARVAMSDETRPWLGPALVAQIRRDAPNVDLRIRSLTVDSARAGRTGEIDVAVFPEPPPGQGPDVTAFVIRTLYTTPWVLGTARDHPHAGRPWTLPEYAAAEHVLVVAWGGDDRGFVDDILAQHGLQRRLVATVPTAAEAVEVVRRTHAVTVLPAIAARGADLALAEVPLPLPPLRIATAWHPRAARDPRVRWLRDQIEAVSAAER